MKTISITGVDGTGKTSVVRELRATHAKSSDLLCAFRAPQYHEDPDAPFGRLSKSIDDLGTHADHTGDPILKTCGLFLSMTLYGDVEAHYKRTFAPQLLVSERQALADSLAYSKFYKGLLTGPLRRESLAGLKDSHDLEALESWIEVLKERLPAGSPIDAEELELVSLPLFVRALFELPPESLLTHLKALYHCTLPDTIILLRVAPDRLAERLAKKSAAGTVRELHESRQVLEALQSGLEQACRSLAVPLHVLDTTELTIKQVADRCLELAGVRGRH